MAAVEKNEVERRLGAALARARKARRLSQAALGRLLGISQTTVSKIESGTAPVSVALLVQWSAVLETGSWRLLAEVIGSEEEARLVVALCDLMKRRPDAMTTVKLLLSHPAGETLQ